MSSTFGSFEIAKSGLSVAMSNLNITGHNISNANTVGYTRQRLDTSAISPDNASYLLSPVNSCKIGQGVQITGTEQIRSAYLDTQYRALNADSNYSDSRTDALTYLEGLFNSETEDGKGLTGSIESFYSALKDFESDTTSEEYRTSVQQSALSMTEDFNVVYNEMTGLWNDQNDSISSDADSINSVAQQLAGLNKSIANYERNGDVANDLRDQRNLLLDKLSGYVDITYGNDADNASMTDVQIGGVDLVKGTAYNTIQVTKASDSQAQIDNLTGQIADINAKIKAGTVSATDGQATISSLVGELGQYIDVKSAPNTDNGVDVTFNGASLVDGSASTPINDAVEGNMPAWAAYNRNNLTLDGKELSIEAGTVTSGELFSHMEMISSDGTNTSLAVGSLYYMEKLNDLAQTISKTMNDITTAGYTYPTDSNISTNGVNLFNVPTDVDGTEHYTKITAGNFTISDKVRDSVWNIAGSSSQITTSSTNSGDSKTAQALYNTLTTGKFYSSLNALVTNLATALGTSKNVGDTKNSLLTSLDTQRSSVSGVSVNEEATNLIIYQQSYNACARVLTTMDQMLQTLISDTGEVGR